MDLNQVKAEAQSVANAVKSDWGQPVQRVILIAVGVACGVLGMIVGHVL